MSSIHSALVAESKKIPARALEKLLQGKLKTAGVRRHRVVAESLAIHILSGSEKVFQWGHGESDRVININFDESDIAELERLSGKLISSVPDVVSRLTKVIAERTVTDLNIEWERERYQEERELRQFRDKIEDVWGEGLDLLRILVKRSRELGCLHSERLSASRARRGRARGVALQKLQIRGCQIAAEILVLLENGFADGALARWRTLHEVAVISLILSDGDDDLSERYLEHDVVEAKKALDRFEKDHINLGLRPPSKTAKDQIGRRYQRLLERYGMPFRHEYGWAASRLGIERPRLTYKMPLAKDRCTRTIKWLATMFTLPQER